MSIITISRQFGSGGDAIARQLCQETGYPLFDKRLVDEAAREAGLNDQSAIDFSEENYKVRSFLDRLFGSTPILPYTGMWPDEIAAIYGIESMRMTEEEQVDLMQKAMQRACQIGNIIIVGRGGQALLQQQHGVVHVRIVAPLENRIARVKETMQQYEAEFQADHERHRDIQAAELIAQRDHASAEYIKRFYHVDWNDAQLYHLVINTGKLSLSQAIPIILQSMPGPQSSANAG